MRRCPSILVVLVLMGCAVFLQSCHTYPFHNVEEKLQSNEWMLTPFPKSNETFITFRFNDSGLEIYADRRLVRWEDNDTTEIEWVLRRGVRSQYLYFPDVPGTYGYYFDANGVRKRIHLKNYVNPPAYFRWQILTLNETELFMSHEDDQNRNGGFQQEFIEYNAGCGLIEAQLQKGLTDYPIDMKRCP